MLSSDKFKTQECKNDLVIEESLKKVYVEDRKRKIFISFVLEANVRIKNRNYLTNSVHSIQTETCTFT